MHRYGAADRPQNATVGLAGASQGLVAIGSRRVLIVSMSCSMLGITCKYAATQLTQLRTQQTANSVSLGVQKRVQSRWLSILWCSIRNKPSCRHES